ncbi:MAG: hypothetical protein K8T90_04080 [Planctomycetes bacterium]|nr:hypothetical protein [Planctomycetota bacterium]
MKALATSRSVAALAVAALLASACALFPPPLPRTPLVSEEGIPEALEKAGANRLEIAALLAHYDSSPDAEARACARFLVANMPGKGYVVFGWKDAKGEPVEFDPLRSKSFAEAQTVLDRIEKERGAIDYVKAKFVPDLETVTAEFLVRHIDRSLSTWRAVPVAERAPFESFLEFVLPYRGSDEPLEDWLTPLQARLDEIRASLPAGAARADLWKAFGADKDKRARFDEIFYLHPTDQSFSEITATGMGRCEDLSNLQTFYARAFGTATACDYTPAWGHRDNNHAWTVELGADGTGSDRGQSHAAKVYRKTFSLHPGLPALLPPGREPPNRWVASRAMIDVTSQYGNSITIHVEPDRAAIGDEKAGYLCVFNGGEWVAIAWAATHPTQPFTFFDMGKGLLYLPIVHDGTKTIPMAAPLLLGKDGAVRALPGTGPATHVALVATLPEQTSADTGATTPVSHLKPGATYTLSRWTGTWTTVEEFVATSSAKVVDGVPSDGLFWLVEKDSRRLERPFTVEGGRQRFW